MIGQYLASIDGIEIVGVAGLLLSLAFFLVIVVRTVRADRAYLDAMTRLPLEDSPAHSHEAGQ